MPNLCIEFGERVAWVLTQCVYGVGERMEDGGTDGGGMGVEDGGPDEGGIHGTDPGTVVGKGG